MAEVELGESIADVARRHRVQPRTLSWWRWRLRSERRRAEPLLLPVVVRRPVAAATADGVIELRVRDVSIRVVSGSDVAYLAALVEALRG